MNFVGLANYQRILTDATMLGLTFTVLYTVATTILITLVAIPLAVVLNRKFFARNFVRSVFFFPPSQPRHPGPGLGLHLVPAGLRSIELAAGECVLHRPVPVAVGRHLGAGVGDRRGVVVLGRLARRDLPGLSAVHPGRLRRVGHRGRLNRQQFFHITLPLLTPAIIISQFLLLTSGLRVYDLPFTLTKGGLGYATNTITQSIITNGVAQGRYGLASALSVLFTLSVAVLVVVQLLASRRLERRVS